MICHWAALNHGRRTVLDDRSGSANRFRATLANGCKATARRPDIDMRTAPAMTSPSMTAATAV